MQHVHDGGRCKKGHVVNCCRCKIPDSKIMITNWLVLIANRLASLSVIHIRSVPSLRCAISVKL